MLFRSVFCDAFLTCDHALVGWVAYIYLIDIVGFGLVVCFLRTLLSFRCYERVEGEEVT